MNIVEYNHGIWLEYPEKDYEGTYLLINNDRYISIEQYCAMFGISVDTVQVEDNNLLITSARPIPFTTIAELCNWDNITINPGYNAFIISIKLHD